MTDIFRASEDLAYDIFQIVTISRPQDKGSPPIESVEGTAFLVARGVLVTCWHCVSEPLPAGHSYGVARRFPLGGVTGTALKDLSRCKAGKDLATAKVAFWPSLGFKLAERPLEIGEDVWTFGYPLTDVQERPGGGKFFMSHPRLLKGHVMRRFMYPHYDLGAVPSYELSFPAPEGLSGAPLFRAETNEVRGVVYGNNDVTTIVEWSSVDKETGKRTAEVQRTVSYGLAHTLESLAGLRGDATRGKRFAKSGTLSYQRF